MPFTDYHNITNIAMNHTNGSDVVPTPANDSELEPKAVEIFRLCLSAIICSTGIVGNLLVVIITTCNRKSRTAVNYYILNLALSDLGILAVCYPFILIKTEDPLHWPLGSFACKIIYPLSDIFYGVSIGSIVAIAMDRYKAIVRSMRAQKTLQAAKWVIMFIWVFSFVGVVLPLYFVMEFLEDTRGHGTVDCTPVWPNWITFRLYVMSLSFFWYVLPLAVIVWVYRKIAQKIRASRALHKSMRSQMGSQYKELKNGKKKKRTRRKYDDSNTKALKILIPVVCVFTITMLPFQAFRWTQMFINVSKIKYIWAYFNVSVVMMLANSSANPIIYSLVSDDFRRRFRQVLCLQWSRLQDSTSSSLKKSSTPTSTSVARYTSQRSFHTSLC